ncbi:hypothetical protein CCUS01_03181 [Colletotrichum cuscutae]|uniref:Uncharacterized protein n=1 Tax=Colletotrichum cuscutae TaxID=1209917 RepID=A0AAI9Y9I4_9PEZI|nr:hypothetical protein CCUS01_03181 [Colletotrichum cuscutae]
MSLYEGLERRASGLFDYGLLPVCAAAVISHRMLASKDHISSTETMCVLVNNRSDLPKLQNNWNTFMAKANTSKTHPAADSAKRAEWKTKGA